MKKFSFSLLASFLLLLSGCQSEDFVNHSKPVGSHSLVATIEGQDYVDASRTAVDDSGNVTWIETDELGVYGTLSENIKYSSTGSGADVTFTGDLPETEEAQWAYYPYDENASLSEGTLAITLPDNYIYTGNSNAPMLGKSSGNNKFSFKHLGGLIRFTLGGGIPANADRFVITSVGENQPIAGQVSFAIEGDNVTLSITSDEKQSISYDISAIKDTEEFQHFFVPLPVGLYSKLEVSFYKKDSEEPIFTRSLSNLTMKRAEMICMPILDWNTGKQYTLSENTTDITDLSEDGVTVTLKESDNSLQLTGLEENEVPEIGQILWSQPTEELPYGFMGKVKETTSSNGTVTITTETVALDEVFDKLLIEETVDLIPTLDSRTSVIDLNKSYNVPIKIQDEDSAYGIEGKLDIETRFLSTIHINKVEKISRMDFSLSLGTGVEAVMEVSASFNEDGDKVEPFELKDFNFPPIILGGGVITINPALQFKLHLSPSGKISFATEVNYVSKCVAGADYRNGQWNYGISELNHNEQSPWSMTSSIDMNGKLFVGAGIEFKGKLYNRDDLKIYLEPVMGIELYGELGISSEDENLQDKLKNLALTTKNVASASFGIDATVLGEQAEASFEFKPVEWGEKQLYLLPMFENLAAQTKTMTSRTSTNPFEATITMIGSREILTKQMEVSFMIEDMVENYKSHAKDVMQYEVMEGGKNVQEFASTFTNLNPNSNYRAYPIVMSPIFGEELGHELELTEQYVSFHSPAVDLRNKLVALYNATGGENWTNNENWLSDRPIEEWYGIHNVGEGKYSIELSANNLSGTFVLSSSDILRIDISENRIETLSLDGCNSLETLYYNNNPLVSLDLSNCPVVNGAEGMNDESTYSLIKYLRMSNCKELISLSIEMPLLESLDLSGCEKLKNIYSYFENGSHLTTVNISGCKEVTELSYFLNDTPLTYLNISGCDKITRLSPLSVGQPHLIEELYAANCTGLTGQVGILPTMKVIDLENCTALESVAYDSANNDKYQLTSLNVKGCSSMEWIAAPRGIYLQEFDMEGCTQLQELHVYLSDNITNIDLSEFTLLEDITIEGNQLQSLDVTDCPLLKRLSFGGAIKTIDLSNNRELENLGTSSALTELDLTYNHELKVLSCHAQLKSLNLADKRKLEAVSCVGNQLEFLDVSGCYNLKSLNCSYGLLTSLDVSDCEILETLHCNNNRLTALDVTKNVNLTSLFCFDNVISDLKVSGCVNLKDLRCQNNQIKVLDVKNHASLEYLSCNNSTLEALDVSGCSQITSLRLSECPNLSSLNFTGCTSIDDMYLRGTGLTQISLNGMSSLIEFDCSNNAQLTSLDFTGCNNLQTLNCAGNPLLVDLVLMSYAPLNRIYFDGTKVTHEIPNWFPEPDPSAGIYFTYEQRYMDYEWITNPDGTKSLNYIDKGYGWWFPGEPESGKHSR